MIGIVVTGHGLFAEGMHSSAKMIAGENDHIKYVALSGKGNPPEEYIRV